jgi:Ca-activated chloride channel family protein
MPPKRPNYYTLLGLLRSASQAEIRRAYLKAAKRLHPDANEGPGETEMFLDVQQAYQILSDPAQRSTYDATLPPEEKIIEVLDQRILVSRTELSRTQENQLVYLLAEFSPKKEFSEATSLAPLNLCLALDCSTSMNGPKLDTVKAAAIQLIRKLKPQDIFSVVSFSDRAEVVIPASRQDSALKMESRIQRLQASGGTEILQALQASLKEVRRFKNPKNINHIILLTDGQTYGDEAASYELAKTAKDENIGISGLGIGNGWNDTFLDKLASLTGGHTLLVSQPGDIERLLTEKFANLSQTFAENVSFEYEIPAGVEIVYAFRLQPEATPLIIETPMQLGPIRQNWPLSVIFEFSVKPQALQNNHVVLIHGLLDIVSASLPTPIPPISLEIKLSAVEIVTPETPPPILVQALSKLTLYRMQERARREITVGNYDAGAQQLQKLATRLLAQGERALAKTIMLEVEHIEKEKKFSELGEKQIKYGTRALLLPGEQKK